MSVLPHIEVEGPYYLNARTPVSNDIFEIRRRTVMIEDKYGQTVNIIAYNNTDAGGSCIHFLSYKMAK